MGIYYPGLRSALPRAITFRPFGATARHSRDSVESMDIKSQESTPALRFDDFVGVTKAAATAGLLLRYRLGRVGLGLREFAHRAAWLLILIKLELRLHRTAWPVIVLDIGVH